MQRTPDGAKGYAHTRKDFWRPDREDVKIDVMVRSVEAKFSQSGFLKRELLATGDSILIENSPHDFFWGIGSDGSGFNMLGKILMEVRVRLVYIF